MHKLRAIISHAYNNIPFYRKLYRTLPTELCIEHLPILSKEVLRSVPFKERVTEAGLRNLHKWDVSYTSGSTGQPLKILRSPQEVSINESLSIRALICQGARITDKICQVRPVRAGDEGNFYRYVEKHGLYGFVRKRIASPIVLSSDVKGAVQLIQKWRPHILIGIPSFLIALADFCERNDLKLTFRMIKTRGELLTKQARHKIEDFFQAEVFDGYGATEVGGIAWECSTHEGFHINAEAVFVEVLRDGSPVGNGEEGEACVTSLYRFTTPFIRYVLGDVIRLVDDECSCGRKLPLIDKILGRTMDVLWRQDGLPVFPLTVLHSLHDIEGLAKFRVVQRGDYVIEVYIEPSDRFEEAVRYEVEKRCKLLFPDTPFILKIGPIIDDGNLKFKPVISHVAKSHGLF